MDASIKKYVIALVHATRYPEKFISPELSGYFNLGASTRGSIALMEV